MILVDTHVWLWLNGSVERLSPQALTLLSSPETEVYLSAASAWEIGIKFAADRLILPLPRALRRKKENLMKNAVRLCAVLAVLASAGFAKPATAVVNDNGCVPVRCDLFCRENGYASGHCVWGVCRCS